LTHALTSRVSSCTHLYFFLYFTFSVPHIFLRLKHWRGGCTILINCQYRGDIITLRALFEILYGTLCLI
jgi:hypothetical protein